MKFLASRWKVEAYSLSEMFLVNRNFDENIKRFYSGGIDGD